MSKRAVSRRLPAPRKDDGTQIKRLRRVCLSIPGTMEKLSHGEPTFFTPKRVFAMFANNHHDDGHVAVWLPAAPGVQEALIDEAGLIPTQRAEEVPVAGFAALARAWRASRE